MREGKTDKLLVVRKLLSDDIDCCRHFMLNFNILLIYLVQNENFRYLSKFLNTKCSKSNLGKDKCSSRS